MWSVVARSMTAAWHSWYKSSFIGSTYLSVSSTNLAWSVTRRGLNGIAPQYLAAHCVPVSATASRQRVRSAASHQLVVPSYRLSSYGRRAFSVACPMTWNSLLKHLRDPVHTTSVCTTIEDIFFQSTSVYSILGAVFFIDALYKLMFYFLTYFHIWNSHADPGYSRQWSLAVPYIIQQRCLNKW